MKIFTKDNLNIDEILSEDEKAKQLYNLIWPLFEKALNTACQIKKSKGEFNYIRDYILALGIKINENYKIEKRIKN